MKSNKIMYFFSIFLIIFAIVMMLGAFYLLLFPFKTVDYLNSPFPVLNANKTVEAGGQLQYQVNYCRYTESPAQVTRFLQNNIVYNLPDSDIKSNMGCNTVVTTIEIPKEVTCGEYKIMNSVRFEVNFLRTITKNVETEIFVVTNCE